MPDRGKKNSLKLVRRKGSSNWYINGTLFRKGVRRSTGTASFKEAAQILSKVIEEIESDQVVNDDPALGFKKLAQKHLNEAQKSSIREDAYHIRALTPYIGGSTLSRIRRGVDDEGNPTALERFILDRARQNVSARTINYSLQVLNRIGNLAVKQWKSAAGKPYLTFWNPAPLIGDEESKTLGLKPKRKPYALAWEEQIRLYGNLPDYLRRMVIFKVNTGCLEQEVCDLKWEWERRIPELSASVFVIPANAAHKKEERWIFLNEFARVQIEACRNDHLFYVFTYKGDRISRINGVSWRKARDRAGLTQLRVQDLKGTFERRLKSRSVDREALRVLLGHKTGSLVKNYGVKEISKYIEYVNRVCHPTA